jgi:hypothetical protein
MAPRLARHREIGEAVAGGVLTAARAVALRAAEAAPRALAAREAAEPFTAGAAARRATATHATALAVVNAAGHLAALPNRREARIARPAPAADAARDRAERDIRPRQEEPGPERACSEQLEELPPRGSPCQLARHCSREIHLGRQARDRGLRRARARRVAGVPPRLARHREVREAAAGTGRTVRRARALRAAKTAPCARPARQAAPPLAAGRAAGGAAAALLAGDARSRRVQVLARADRRSAGITRPAAAADAARDCAERDVGTGEEEAGAERACAE